MAIVRDAGQTHCYWRSSTKDQGDIFSSKGVNFRGDFLEQ